MNLKEYDLIIINSSAGKDSLCALYEVNRIAEEQNYPKSKMVLSHQDLGEAEWEGTRELVQTQADFFGLKTYYSKRRNKDGYEESLLEYVERRGKWPSNKQRFCTSDFKRAPGLRVVTMLTKDMPSSKVLYVFGFRAAESPARAKKKVLVENTSATTKKRKVYDWNPILDWSTKKVWDTIKANKLPYHKAYDIGMPRLSCCFCIFASFDDLVTAGKANPELLDKYVETEQRIGHSFKKDTSIESVRNAIIDSKPVKLF